MRHAEHLAPAERARQLVGEEVRDAGVADLAGMDQVVEGEERLIDRGVRVPGVELVQVDVIGAEPAQRPRWPA